MISAAAGHTETLWVEDQWQNTHLNNDGRQQTIVWWEIISLLLTKLECKNLNLAMMGGQHENKQLLTTMASYLLVSVLYCPLPTWLTAQTLNWYERAGVRPFTVAPVTVGSTSGKYTLQGESGIQRGAEHFYLKSTRDMIYTVQTIMWNKCKINVFECILKCNVFLWWQSWIFSVITLVFSVTWSFRHYKCLCDNFSSV